MKLLVVGSGGREHAVIRKLKENKEIEKIYCAPGNGGISADAECVDIKATDKENMVKFAKENAIDFCVVTPDDPLALGMVDDMEEAGIPCFGPKANAAIIEASKAFSKDLMKKYGIPTADYETFDNEKEALHYIEEKNTFPIVIKADGLALGKGVLICETLDDAKAALREMMVDHVFGLSGNKVVVEEFMTGKEVSVLAFTDGNVVKPMISSMDHKRAYDNDEGLNTGGMGTIAPSPYYTKEIAETCMETIFLPTVKAMNTEGRTFKGCLYFGLMLTPKGPRVVEYNCRFGDPETQVVLPLLKTDFVDIIEAISKETLGDLDIQWKDGCAACVVMASGGYPKSYPKGLPISGLNAQGQTAHCLVYHAGTQYDGQQFITAGGRVLGVTATADTLKDALARAYDGVNEIHFDQVHYRKDIGQRALRASAK